jgi:hypothetical protein
MDHGRVVKRIYDSKQEGRRRMGRPRLRWLEDVQKDLQEMKAKSWWQKAMDKEEGVSVIKLAKALRGP